MNNNSISIYLRYMAGQFDICISKKEMKKSQYKAKDAKGKYNLQETARNFGKSFHIHASYISYEYTHFKTLALP